MKINNKVIEDYIESTRPRYDDEVLTKIFSESYDKELTEQSVIELYTKKNNGIKPIITWVDSPINLRDSYPGKNIKVFSSYFNINWVYFYKTFIEMLGEKELKPEYIYYDFESKKDVFKDSKLMFNIFSNTFGVGEISGVDETTNTKIKYKEIVLIKKPSDICLFNGKLHSIKGPSFVYKNSNLKFYYIEGIKFEEDMWVRIIKTGLNNPNSTLNDQLKDYEIKDLKKYIKDIEKTIGVQKELSVKEILLIENVEEKSKIIRYIGLNKIVEVSNLIGEESVTTHKGDIVNYQLFEIDLGLEVDKIPSRFVKVVCWSTGKEYVLQVDPRNRQCETPIGAIAWTCIKPDGTHCTIDEYLELESQT